MRWNGRPLREAAGAVALLDGALHLTLTCRPLTTWRTPSRRLGGLGHVIIAVDVPILLAISLHTLREAAIIKPACTPPQQAPTLSRAALQRAHYLVRDAVAHQVVATTAATRQGTTAVITGIDAAATAAAVIAATAAARMTALTPQSLPHLSLNAKTCCFSLA